MNVTNSDLKLWKEREILTFKNNSDGLYVLGNEIMIITDEGKSYCEIVRYATMAIQICNNFTAGDQFIAV